MATIPLKYVGLKDSETDHLYGTGLTWIPGVAEVHDVDVRIAALMLKHADVWADARSEEERAAKPVHAVPDAPRPVIKDAVERTNEPDITAVELFDSSNATPEQINEYAMRNFGTEFEIDMPVEEMRVQLQGLIRNREDEIAAQAEARAADNAAKAAKAEKGAGKGRKPAGQ